MTPQKKNVYEDEKMNKRRKFIFLSSVPYVTVIYFRDDFSSYSTIYRIFILFYLNCLTCALHRRIFIHINM